MKGDMGQYEEANIIIQIIEETGVDGFQVSQHLSKVDQFADSKEKETHNRKLHLVHLDKNYFLAHVLKFYLKLADLFKMFD